MIKESSYQSEWQNNRIKFVLSKYPNDFFNGKKVLELGSFNGYIGSYFNEIGSEVLSLEGRESNVANIKNDYPNLEVQHANLDTPDWIWGKWDIIINFGLYYHLEKFHKEHLKNCVANCDLMFFETVIYDSFESEIHFRNESGADQSLSNVGGTPSTSYVENILTETNASFTKFCNSELNGGPGAPQHYDWEDKNSKIFDMWSRRFWIIEK